MIFQSMLQSQFTICLCPNDLKWDLEFDNHGQGYVYLSSTLIGYPSSISTAALVLWSDCCNYLSSNVWFRPILSVARPGATVLWSTDFSAATTLWAYITIAWVLSASYAESILILSILVLCWSLLHLFRRLFYVSGMILSGCCFIFLNVFFSPKTCQPNWVGCFWNLLDGLCWNTPTLWSYASLLINWSIG